MADEKLRLVADMKDPLKRAEAGKGSQTAQPETLFRLRRDLGGPDGRAAGDQGLERNPGRNGFPRVSFLLLWQRCFRGHEGKDQTGNRAGMVMNQPTLKIEVLPGNEDLGLPAYATEGSAGLDLRAALTEILTIEPGRRDIVPTGLKMAIPMGFEGSLRPPQRFGDEAGFDRHERAGNHRRGLPGRDQSSLDQSWSRSGCPEAGRSHRPIGHHAGSSRNIEQVQSLDETVRGAGGFGHTGVH